MRNNFLVFGKPYIGKREIEEVVNTLKSGWWGTGPKTELFEKKFRKYIGSNYSLAVNSATAGLHLALKVLEVSSGDEVITTPLTFCSTVNAIVNCGARPVFADVDKDTWNIDPNEIERRITKRTRVILPVHLHGRPANMDKIMEIARKNNLYVVEDAAHAVESLYKGKKIGNIGDITVFSFYVTKNLATGEGGMITTNNKEWVEKMRMLSLHGLSADAYKRYSIKQFREYQCLYPGYKYNMTDLAASIGIHQLAKIKSNALKRKKSWNLYDKSFSKDYEIGLPADEEENTYHARHLYAIILPLEKLTINRNEFVDCLIKRNIGSGVHFNPVHLHKYYRDTFFYKKGDYPNAEYIGERIISLPLGANLKTSDIHDVVNEVRDILKKYHK